jgi:hypothetical protein
MRKFLNFCKMYIAIEKTTNYQLVEKFYCEYVILRSWLKYKRSFLTSTYCIWQGPAIFAETTFDPPGLLQNQNHQEQMPNHYSFYFYLSSVSLSLSSLPPLPISYFTLFSLHTVSPPSLSFSLFSKEKVSGDYRIHSLRHSGSKIWS